MAQWAVVAVYYILVYLVMKDLEILGWIILGVSSLALALAIDAQKAQVSIPAANIHQHQSDRQPGTTERDIKARRRQYAAAEDSGHIKIKKEGQRDVIDLTEDGVVELRQLRPRIKRAT